MFALFALKGQKCRIHIDEVCTRRHLRPIFRGRPPARGAPRRRLPGRVPTRKKRLDNGSRMNRVAGGGAGRGHLAGLGMDEARSRPGRGWLVQQLSGEWFGLRPGRGRPSPSSRFVTWLIYLPGWGAADWFSN